MLLTGDIVQKADNQRGKVVARRVDGYKLFVLVKWADGRETWHRDDHKLLLI